MNIIKKDTRHESLVKGNSFIRNTKIHSIQRKREFALLLCPSRVFALLDHPLPPEITSPSLRVFLWPARCCPESSKLSLHPFQSYTASQLLDLAFRLCVNNNHSSWNPPKKRGFFGAFLTLLECENDIKPTSWVYLFVERQMNMVGDDKSE